MSSLKVWLFQESVQLFMVTGSQCITLQDSFVYAVDVRLFTPQPQEALTRAEKYA